MSVPHVSSRGTMRESHPPPHWEEIQKGNLRQRQPRPLLVNMFFFFSFLSPPPILSLKLFIPIYHLAELASQFLHQLMRNGSAEFGMEATRGIPFRVRECFHGADNRRTFHSVLLPCNICKTLLFPTTPPPSRNLHPRTTHTHRCTHIHTQPQYPLPLFWCTT